MAIPPINPQRHSYREAMGRPASMILLFALLEKANLVFNNSGIAE